MPVSNKQARKTGIKAKGKGKQEPPKAAPPPAEPAPELEDEDEDESDSDDDGVTEEGMNRLMELVGPEDLNEFEMAQLTGGEDDEDSEEDEEEDDDEEEEEEEEEEDEEMAAEDDSNSIIVDEADGDAVAVDELGSDLSVDEDAVPMRKITTSNKPAMRTLTETIRMTNTPFAEHLIVQSKTNLDVDAEDDLQRETAFYKLALDAVPIARKACAKADILFARPSDYYAEMVKSDEHMERVRTKLVEESQGIKKSEEAKKQRELKKYGKQIQHEKLKQREQDKKSFADRMQGVKRKRKDGMEIGAGGDEDDFGVQVEDAIEDRGDSRGGKGGKPKVPRHVRDAKYSLGGSSRRSKQNTKESTNDFAGWNDKAGAKKGKGGASQRPGKARRHSRRK